MVVLVDWVRVSFEWEVVKLPLDSLLGRVRAEIRNT